MKKYFSAPLFLFLFILLGAGCGDQSAISSFSEPTKQPAVVSSSVKEKEQIPVVKTQVKEVAPEPKKTVPIQPAQTEVSDYAPNGTYTNAAGNEVPSPYEASSVPAGASAQCRDGSYSFSQSRRGTCSHHGGVAEWL